jgi:phenylacetate-CoA ligase
MLDFFTILKILGYPVGLARKEFKRVVNFDISEDSQIKRCWTIFGYHYKNNPFYRDFVKEIPIKWTDVPVLKRINLRGDYSTKLPSDINMKEQYLSSTSGSSGDPLFFARDKFTHVMVWLNVERLYASAGVSLNHRQARVFGMSKKMLSGFTARVKDFISNRYRFNVFNLSDESLKNWLNKFRNNRFVYIYGYTNSLVAFAQYLLRNNKVLVSEAPRLKACIVTSEVCTDNDAETLTKAFGVPVYNEYGSSELGIMGFKKDEYWEASDELMYFEVLDDQDNVLPYGDLGHLTCTSFYNKSTPFIRYQTGDLASISRVNGRTRIHKIMGSLNDMAILPSGKKVPGISFYFVTQDLIENSDSLKEFLFRQNKSGFVFEYVAAKELSTQEFDRIKKGFDTHLEKGISLTAKRVEELQRGKNGKFKHFISEL